MKIISHEQQSQEWYEWRRSGIGASESAAILDMSPYKTTRDIWEEKTGRAFPDMINSDMARGLELEAEARQVYSEKYGDQFIPMCGQSEEYSNIIASFDGISKDMKTILEIKCPRPSSNKMIDALESLDKFKEVYPFYYCQIQHQYLVNDTADKAFIFAYKSKTDNKRLFVPKDDGFISEKLTVRLLHFWFEHVTPDIEPPASESDYIIVDDEHAIAVAEEWKLSKEKLDMAKNQEKKLRSTLIEYGDDGNCIVGDVKLTRYSTTRIDYKKACEDHGIDLAKYKKTQVGFYRITEMK